jgi:hypothetical protein
MRPLGSILLLGLALFSTTPAQAAPVLNGPAVNTMMVPFEPYLHPVTDDNTPEWAKLPHAKAWYEITLGIEQGGIDGMLLVLRGVLFMYQGQVWVTPWVDLIPSGGQGDPGGGAADTPEPGTAAVTLLALGALLATRSLRRRARRGTTN